MKPRKSFFPNGFDIDMSPLQDFVHRMDTFFNDSFKHLKSKSFIVNTHETDSHVIVEAELPGYTHNQIQSELIGNQLRITVENKVFDADKKSHSFEKLERIITLPTTISKNNTKATLENGILKIIFPKKEVDRKFININDIRKD